MSNQNNQIRDQSDDLTITDKIQIVGWLVKIAISLLTVGGLYCWIDHLKWRRVKQASQ